MDTSVERGLRAYYRDGSPGVRHVALVGEADLATAGQLEHDLKRLSAPHFVTRLALDLTTLRHLDCAALAALLVVREYATGRGQRIVITAAVGVPDRVLTLTAVGHLFGYPAPPVATRRISLHREDEHPGRRDWSAIA